MDSVSNIRIVVSGCKEPDGRLGADAKWHLTRSWCRDGLSDVDAREAGPMLNFIIDNYGNVEEEKIIFIHAHENSGHYLESIWRLISRLITRFHDEFWSRDFGNVATYLFVTTGFEKQNGRLYSMIEAAFSWANLADIIDVLFNGTSMANVPKDFWEIPCCATFFVNTSLLWKRPKHEYVRLRDNIRSIVERGLCNVFPHWKACSLPKEEFDKKYRTDRRFTDDFILGLGVEKLWGVILANRSRFEGPWLNTRRNMSIPD
jgi:hypothetical protein